MLLACEAGSCWNTSVSGLAPLLTRLLPSGSLCSLSLAREPQRWACSYARNMSQGSTPSIHFFENSRSISQNGVTFKEPLNSWTFPFSGRYFRNDVTSWLFGVSPVRAYAWREVYFWSFFRKKGRTFGDSLSFVKYIWIFPDEYVFRQSVYRRKRFTSLWRQVLSQKRAELCFHGKIHRATTWKAACSFWSFCFMPRMDQALAKEGPQGFSLGKKTPVSVFIFLLYCGSYYKSFKTHV